MQQRCNKGFGCCLVVNGYTVDQFAVCSMGFTCTYLYILIFGHDRSIDQRLSDYCQRAKGKTGNELDVESSFLFALNQPFFAINEPTLFVNTN